MRCVILCLLLTSTLSFHPRAQEQPYFKPFRRASTTYYLSKEMVSKESESVAKVFKNFNMDLMKSNQSSYSELTIDLARYRNKNTKGFEIDFITYKINPPYDIVLYGHDTVFQLKKDELFYIYGFSPYFSNSRTNRDISKIFLDAHLMELGTKNNLTLNEFINIKNLNSKKFSNKNFFSTVSPRATTGFY